MSSDPNTPDFDSMSPEEMMAWMESLAKRQGADEGFTTAADVEIDEVDPDTVDESILNQKYIPDGWTEEKWEAHLAKEEAEKEARRAAREAEAAPAQSTPLAEVEPEPEEEPEVEAVASQAAMSASSDELDYDNMSPEELMAFMESLAKRQGATEGFTTAADMEVAEIDPDTVDESIRNQKYIPDGWTEEKWDAYLVEEERKKQEKLSQPQPEPELVDEDDALELDYDDEDEELAVRLDDFDELELIDDEDEELATLNMDDLPTLDLTEEEETEAAAENPMAWLENLAATDDDSEEIDIPDLSSLGDDMGGLSALAEEDADSDPMDWLANLAGDVDDGAPELDLEDMSAGLEGLEAFALGGDDGDEDDDDEDESLVDLSEVGDPVSFLDNLARMEGAPEDELSTDADQAFLDSLETDDDEELIEIPEGLEDTQPSEELSFLANAEDAELEAALPWDEQDPSSIDNPEAWLDALAQNTSGDAQLSMFDDDEDDIDLLQEMDDEVEDEEEAVAELPELDEEDEEDGDHDTRVLEALNSGQDVAPEDIEDFFKRQFEKAEQFAHLDEDFDEPEEEGEVEAAVAPNVPDWLQELSSESPDAQAAAEEDEDEGEDLMADVLADLETEDAELEIDGLELDLDAVNLDIDDDDEAEQVGIPDWLSDSAPSDDEAEAVGIPDWLSENAEEDTGDVIADIIADQADFEPGETTLIETGSGQVEVDPSDTWTQAFLMENREEDAEAWYSQRLSELGEDVSAAQTASEPEPEPEPEDTTPAVPSGAVSLEPATLPIEEELPEGQPELAPEWLTGVASDEEELPVPDFEMMAEDDGADDIPSWLEDSIADDDEIELPDWLHEDDSDDEAIPDWLRDAEGSDVEPAAIPDWLTDTVEEPEEVIMSPVPEPEPEPAAMVVAPPPAADVSGAIQAAQQKVSAGNVDDALVDYESVVRANDSLDVVINDLQKLTNDETHKKNPAIYRCLGDALMRNGDLQTALDTYRRALNLL